MIKNIKGYFRGFPDNDLYEVAILPSDSEAEETVEVLMGGDRPFVVTYDSSDNPFEPIRTSTAVLEIVNDNYLMDMLSPYPDGTQVILYKYINETDKKVEWCGYLKANLNNQDYSSCNETIQFNASDCICLLQYKQYKTSKKNVVSFLDILSKIVSEMKQIDSVCIAVTKNTDDGQRLDLSKLKISEQNFFTEDTDESWTLYDVLEEITKYLGYTAVQYGSTLYLMDAQWLATNEITEFSEYVFLGGRLSYRREIYMNTSKSITAESYLQSGADISVDNIYNKATVRASIYDVENFIPDIWSDKNLDNRYGDWNSCSYIPAYGKLQYVNGKNNIKYEDYPDNKAGDDGSEENSIYVHRYLDNKYYKSHYYSAYNQKEVTILPNKITSEYISRPYYSVYGSTYIANSSVSFKNTGTEDATVEYYLSIRVDWFDTEAYMPDYDEVTEQYTVNVPAGETVVVNAGAQIQMGQQYQSQTVGCSDVYYVNGTPYQIGQGGLSEDAKYIGGTIIDLASYDRLPTREYNYEPTPSLNFSRYLCIHQDNHPLTGHVDESNNYANHLNVFELNEGYSLPLIYNENTYLVINCNAIAERYCGKNYINKDWTSEATGIDGGFHFFQSMSSSVMVETLIFKLGIGRYYWNGAQWTTTETCFHVPLSSDVDNKYKIDFMKAWNTQFHVLNNFSWEEWTGAEGYRIPIDSRLNMGDNVTFEVRLPSKLQTYYNSNDSKNTKGKLTLNGYLWLSDLKLEIVQKGEDYDKDDDIVYENVIDEIAVNELSEITCKINTNPGKGRLSYSYVGLNNSFLTSIKDFGLGDNAKYQKPEENIIEKLYNHYSSPTKKENITIGLDFKPFDRVIDTYWESDNVFTITSQEIDYMMGRQTVSITELKDPNKPSLSVSPKSIQIEGNEDTTNTISIITNTRWSIE